MARRASGKRKRGKCVRRARAGQAGGGVLTSIDLLRNDDGSKKGKKKKMFMKRQQARLEKRLARMDNEDEAQTAATTTTEKVPRTFVLHYGKRKSRQMARLVNDVRRCMEPYTASKLQVKRSNRLKDFVETGPHIGVTHIVAFTQSETRAYMRLIRLPHGPTLTFEILSYTLAGEVASTQRRQVSYEHTLMNPPALVMNDYHQYVTDKNSRHLVMVQAALQNMFPRLKVDYVKLSSVRRVVLLDYDVEEDVIHWRHYLTKTRPADLPRGIKKVVAPKRSRAVPDLSRLNDISEILTKAEVLSDDSEWEDEVIVDNDVKPDVDEKPQIPPRGAYKGDRVNVRLIDIGPRMSLRLIRIDESTEPGTGTTLYQRETPQVKEEKMEE